MAEEVLPEELYHSGNKFIMQAFKKSFWTVARYSMIMFSAHIITGGRNTNTLRLGTKKQDFLEARGENVDLPLNTHTDDLPLMARVVSNKRIAGSSFGDEVRHIVIRHYGKMRFWEGQKIGVIPRGVDSNGHRHSAWQYYVASSRYGDNLGGDTLSLCIRKPPKQYLEGKREEDLTAKDVCSGFLCSVKPNDAIMLTGPFGKELLLSEEDKSTDYIFVASGTGIAPFRAFLRRLFAEHTRISHAHRGTTLLFFGVPNQNFLLYEAFFKSIKLNYPQKFGRVYAYLRGGIKKDGRKVFIHDKMREYAEEIITKLDRGAHIYFSGSMKMMGGISIMFEEECALRGIDYESWVEDLRKNGQWHIEGD
eukprot:CAMPEP_0116033686 /NCGR_PEP_ID=MMETSP0321-20121206/19148_1 /TAXON_ID=163516 /ORGANISM="Leptocylindrus danicus var. danicus, Strain B650" /LENGTH=363 /DNA_ID=CAMNT_0003509831 /DNA_START=506 /DNA_END=1597 /DNA_ORIENTATION=+